MVYAIILAAGSSTRLKSKTKKQYIKFNGKPVVYYSIDKFLSMKNIDKVILVISEEDKNSDHIKTLIKKYKKYIHCEKLNMILGGKERYDSVYAALDFIDYCYGINKNDKVLIHDSARPNFSKEDTDKLIKLLDKHKSITLGFTLTDTIKEIYPIKSKKINTTLKVKKTHDRTNFCLISTPQAFNLKLIYDAYDKFINSKKHYTITDDVQLIELFTKEKSYILLSDTLNHKITLNADIDMIKYILKNK